MLRRLVDSQSFALIDFLLVLLSGAVWMIRPDVGHWVILVALLPWMVRLIAGRIPFRLTSLDGLVLIFLITAWVGYWASYDGITAWRKIWFIVLAVLLYYVLAGQPRQNRRAISYLLFTLGVGISIYFLLTHDFAAIPRKLQVVNMVGTWIMSVRPSTGWTPIHPNYVAGIVALTVPFVFYPIWRRAINRRGFPVLYTILIGLGIAVAGLALVMATSRGVMLALGSGLGALALWKFINLRSIQTNRLIFTASLFLFLAVVITLLYLGPAQSAGGVTGNYSYGNGSRAELFSRSLYLVADAPLTGGGLGSFPGLYSRYLLSIPFFYLPNSHNLFLDVAIEQGIPGGLVFLLLYLASLWIVSGRVAEESSASMFNKVVLFSLVVAVVHGMVDNYLYNDVGSMLALLPVGLSMHAGQAERSTVRFGIVPVFAGVLIVLLIIGVVAVFNPLRSIWQSNLGAVTLAKSELAGFPLGVWTGISDPPALATAEVPLRSALQLDPANRTANHRLGLIAMTRGDFEAAAVYLEAALNQAPEHRGIVKSLGFCYAWLGDWEKAQPLLERIPESQSELEVYGWWWDTQGRNDLSDHASQMALRLKNKAHQ